MKNWGIRSRVLVVAIAPVLVLAIAMYAYFIGTRFADLDESLRSRGQALARQLAAASEYPVFAGDRAALDKLARAVLLDPDVVEVTVLDGDGGVLIDVSKSGKRSAQTAAGERLVSIETPIRRESASLEEYFGDAVLPAGFTVLGKVTLDISRHSLFERKRDLLLTSMLLLLGVLAGSVTLAVFMSRGVIRPVQRIANAVRAIGQGDFKARLEPEGDESLRRLAEGLNHMADEMGATQAELHRRIAEATRQLLEKKDEAEKANLAKSRFLAAASHDLRQPMHALGLFVAELLQRAEANNIGRLAHQIAASADALENLLDALLDISKLDAGAMHATIDAFPLQPVFDRMQSDYGKPARDKGLRLRCRPTAAWVSSDRVLVERILLNLVSNAVRYTKQGSILIACRIRGDSARIEVRDSGIGIAEHDRERIFQEFVQLHNPERDRGKGLGLGLAIVQRLSSLLGHPLTLASSPGQGSIFAIDLPRAQARPITPASLPGLDVDRVLRDKLIVVVEDDKLSLSGVDSLLRSWHCRVVSGANEQIAMDELLELDEPPRIIICDYRLAGTRNGIEVIEGFRAAFDAPIHGVIVTGDTVDTPTVQARASGCHLLHKPVRPAKLRALLQQLLKN